MVFRKRMPPPGSRPGTLVIPEDAAPPHIHVFEYGRSGFRESDVDDPEALQAAFESPETTWVDVQGFGDEAKLRAIGRVFGLHALTLEDATNVPQRARSELHAEHLLAVARLPLRRDDGELELPQVCILLGDNWILTFQDRYFGFFDRVRARIREGLGPIRELGPDYLLYALLDTLVDHYFPLVTELIDELDDLEVRVADDPKPRHLQALHRIRRDLVLIRRIGWPQREALRNLTLDHGSFVKPEVLVYLRHAEQHLAQVMEAVDAARDSAMGLVDLYMSVVGQRTNEVMKVLTLMASIFIPLTFVAGIYGMNFEAMPELKESWGYPMVLVVMVSIAVGMVVFFRRRGWLGDGGDDEDEDE